jgi:hypothetical protein
MNNDERLRGVQGPGASLRVYLSRGVSGQPSLYHASKL